MHLGSCDDMDSAERSVKKCGRVRCGSCFCARERWNVAQFGAGFVTEVLVVRGFSSSWSSVFRRPAHQFRPGIKVRGLGPLRSRHPAGVALLPATSALPSRRPPGLLWPEQRAVRRTSPCRRRKTTWAPGARATSRQLDVTLPPSPCYQPPRRYQSGDQPSSGER